VTKRGAVIRQGDIIKFGRVPILIKESSIDAKRWKILKKKEEDQKDPNLDASASNYGGGKPLLYNQQFESDLNNSQIENLSNAQRRDLD